MRSGSTVFNSYYGIQTIPFSDGCTTYNLTSHQICLKYFPVSARYSSARNLCQAEGGDLIKIDSERKFDIFRKHHVPVANNSEIQVWVQGEKVGGQWQFDDGTPIPDICPIQMSNGTTEVHYRAKAACATGYATYNYTDTQICLKYVSAPASYPEAAQQCQAEGGDLIKLDSKLKYEIMKDYLVPIANGVTIDVWIQGENFEGSLIFHDGSPFPTDIDTFCPLYLGDYPTETRVRARGFSTFVCWDRSQDVPFSYLCEYYLVLATEVNSLYISSWIPIQAQVTSPVIITHPLGHIPAKVDVQVKVHESGSDYIFPASGSAQRDDDSENVYGGVVYIYNEFHVKIFVPIKNNESDKGLVIYTASSYQSVTHGLSRYPDLVVVQLKMSNGYVSEAGGVTFNSVSQKSQTICGTVFAYDDQQIRIWSASGSYVFCASDGWGKDAVQSKSATLYIQAWVLCTNQLTRTFFMDKNNADIASPTVDRVPLKSVYSLDSMLVSVEMKALSGNNTGFTFYAGGSAMIDKSSDAYGAIIYAYTETEVFLWRPDIAVTNGYLIYVGGIWGAGTNNQQDTIVEVTVKVIDFNGSPCSETYDCKPNWAYLASSCASTDCPTPDDIPNANKLYDGVSNGSRTLYSCANGYTGSSNDSMTHCVDGAWTTAAMHCEVPCAEGYANYKLMSDEICLKYFPVPVTYSTAQSNCQAEGADLIKIDSQEKYDIFNDFHVPIANNAVIKLWVQGEKVGGQWLFDDGTLMPGFCPISMSNNPGEVHLRAEGSTSMGLDDLWVITRGSIRGTGLSLDACEICPDKALCLYHKYRAVSLQPTQAAARYTQLIKTPPGLNDKRITV
uniref:Uncharacterized protein n=1 Tax=Magallana gigas TaxID=29159 RepID=K1R1M3_MAGGI